MTLDDDSALRARQVNGPNSLGVLVSYYPPVCGPQSLVVLSSNGASSNVGSEAARRTEAEAASAQYNQHSVYAGGGRFLRRGRLTQSEIPSQRQRNHRGRELHAEILGQGSAEGVLRVATTSISDIASNHVVTALHRVARLSKGSDGRTRSGFDDPIRVNSYVIEPIWQTLVNRAGLAARRNELSTMSMALCVWSLATMRHRDVPALEAFGVALLTKKDQCTPHDLSGVAWAVASLALEATSGDAVFCGAGPLLTAFGRESASRVAEFKPQDISLIVWAFARSSFQDPMLFGAMGLAAARRHREFGGQNLANTLWAFGTLAINDEPLFLSMASSALENILELGPLELSTVLWACASVSHDDVKLFGAASLRMRGLPGALERQQLCSVVWAFARIGLRDSEFFRFVACEIVGRALPLVPSELNRVAWAFAFPGRPAEERTGRAGGFRDAPLMRHVALCAIRQLSDLDCVQTSSVAWAFATLLCKENALFEQMCEHLVRSNALASFDEQNIAYMLWALARLDVRNERLCDQACHEAMSRGLAAFDPKHLAMLLWALARSDLRQHDFWAAVEAFVPPTYTSELGNAQAVSCVAMVIHALNRVGEWGTASRLLTNVLELGIDVSGDAYGGWLSGARAAKDSDAELRLWEHMARTAPVRGMRAAAGNMCAIRAFELLGDARRANLALDLVDEEGLTNAVSILLRERCACALGDTSGLERVPPGTLGWKPRLRSEGMRQARAAGRILCKWDYYKEVGVLEYVLDRATPGDPDSVCAAIEAFSRDEHLYLKLGAEEKGLALDALLSAAEVEIQSELEALGGALVQKPNIVVEIGCYVGYSAVRMGRRVRDWQNGLVVSIEVDPYHVAVSRSILELAGLGSAVEIWLGHSENMIQTLLPRFGPGSVRATFFDQKGTRYHDDLAIFEASGLLASGALISADNTVRPGAPEFVWRVCEEMGDYETQVIAHRDYGQDSVEDWITISRLSPGVDRPFGGMRRALVCPPALTQLAYESDQMRNRSINERVTEEEWRIFALRVQREFESEGIAPPILWPASEGHGLTVRLLPWTRKHFAGEMIQELGNASRPG